MCCSSLCSLCKAWNIPGLGLLGINLKTYCFGAILRILEDYLSLYCVSIVFVEVLWYILLPHSSVLQSVM